MSGAAWSEDHRAPRLGNTAIPSLSRALVFRFCCYRASADARASEHSHEPRPRCSELAYRAGLSHALWLGTEPVPRLGVTLITVNLSVVVPAPGSGGCCPCLSAAAASLLKDTRFVARLSYDVRARYRLLRACICTIGPHYPLRPIGMIEISRALYLGVDSTAPCEHHRLTAPSLRLDRRVGRPLCYAP